MFYYFIDGFKWLATLFNDFNKQITKRRTVVCTQSACDGNFDIKLRTFAIFLPS